MDTRHSWRGLFRVRLRFVQSRSNVDFYKQQVRVVVLGDCDDLPRAVVPDTRGDGVTKRKPSTRRNNQLSQTTITASCTDRVEELRLQVGS